MFDREYDNPMTFGDYGSQDSPDHSMICPRCGMAWSGYESDCGVEWECADDAYASSYMPPVMNGICRICAWQDSTAEQRLKYINEHRMQTDMLEHMLCGNRGGIRRYKRASDLWDVLTGCEDDTVRAWMDDQIRDYIHDENLDDFVDWMIKERGRVHDDMLR